MNSAVSLPSNINGFLISKHFAVPQGEVVTRNGDVILWHGVEREHTDRTGRVLPSQRAEMVERGRQHWRQKFAQDDTARERCDLDGERGMCGTLYTPRTEEDIEWLAQGYADAEVENLLVAYGIKERPRAIPGRNLVLVDCKDLPLDLVDPDNPGLTAEERQTAVVAGDEAWESTRVKAQERLAAGQQPTEQQTATDTKPSLVMPIRELMSKPVQPDYFADKTIERNTTGQIIGASGSGKTFVALDVALCGATGTPWNGHQVKQGQILYLCGEGIAGIPRRIQAWLTHHNKTVDDLSHFHVSRQAITFEPGNIASLQAEARALEEAHGLPFVFFLIDTLARHMPDDRDENSNKDMGFFAAQADRLRGPFPGSVAMIVHHTGHAETGRGRGGSSLKGAMDFEMLVDKKGTIEFTKMKDGETPPKIEFKLQRVTLGQDENGDVITSCVPVYGERSEANQESMTTEMEHIAINALILASVGSQIQHEGKWGALVGDWREMFYELRKKAEPDIRQGTLRESFKRACNGLVGKGIVAEHGNVRTPSGRSNQDEIITRLSMPHTTHWQHIGNTCGGDGTPTHNTHPLEGCVDVGHPVTVTGDQKPALPDWAQERQPSTI